MLIITKRSYTNCLHKGITMNDKIILLLTQLQAAIINSTEKIKVCMPSTDNYYNSNSWCEESIQYIDQDRLSQEILDIIKTYE